MNLDELRKTLKAQRARRQVAMEKQIPPARPRGKDNLKTALLLGCVTLVSVGLFVFFMTLPSLAATQHFQTVPVLRSSLAPSIFPTTSPTLRPTSINEIVCTDVPDGRLNVHFDPGTTGTGKEIRGYLKEGEMVLVVGVTSDGQWSEISNPVEGWVSSRYLCEDKR